MNLSENLNNIFTKYIEDFDSKFSKDMFIKEKKYNLVLESTEYVTNRYTLTVPVNEFYTFIKEEVTLMKSDDTLKAYALDKFGITNSLLEENLNSIINKCDQIISESDESSIFKIYVYEKDGATLKVEASTDNISYECYVYKTDSNIKFLWYYNNIELVTRKTVETQKLVIENEYDSESMDISVEYTSKAKNENKTDGNMAEYNESNYRIQYGIHNVKEDGADRSFVLILNNKRVLEYKSKITVGVNVEIETINSENSHVINDMSETDLRDLISLLTENAASFIDVSELMEEEEEPERLIDTSTLDSAKKDLNSAFLNIEAAYNLDSNGESLYDYFNQERLENAANFGNEMLLSNEKNIILYRNKARQVFQFWINVTESKIEIEDCFELHETDGYDLVDIMYPQEEPEPSEEDVTEEEVNNSTAAIMKSEIESYLAAIYDEAITSGEELYAADYINENQLVANCSTIIEAYTEERDGGMFYIECKDIDENIYSGIIQITGNGLNLLLFN